jgi:hypothetical protein
MTHSSYSKSCAYIFLSHDSRDFQIAESFANLLKAVSAGLLKCYFTSDTKGSSGISYGEEWYPAIHEQIRESVHLICILTERSIGRPWILYEAGIAKGLDRLPVTGLLIGVQSQRAYAGPFSHFQNCIHDVESLIKLVNELLSQALPGCDPDKTLIKNQVKKHKREIAKILGSRTNELHDNKDTKSIVRFIEDMKSNVAAAIDEANEDTDLKGDNDLLYLSFAKHPDEYLKKFFSNIDVQFCERIARNGKLKRMSQLVDFSSAALVGSLLELGLPLSLSLHVPSAVIDILEGLIKDGVIDDEIDSSHIRTAVVRSFDMLQERQDSSPDRIELTRSSYIRRYGNPDNQYLKVIDRGVERDLNYSFIINELLPHVLKRILETDVSPTIKFRAMFSASRLKEMAREVMYATSQLNLYSIRYKALIHLIQDIVIQPPHPWIVSKETENSVFAYNLERMEAHFQSIHDLIDLEEIPSTSYHHLKEFFQHSAAAILSKYGAYLGVGQHYGLLELTRTLSLINGNTVLWENCRIKEIERDLERLDCSLTDFRRAANKVQEKLTCLKSQQKPLVNEIRLEIDLFLRLARGYSRLN